MPTTSPATRTCRDRWRSVAARRPSRRRAGLVVYRKKGEWWAANHEVHEVSADGPYLNGDQFAVRFYVDVTVKETGERRKMHEIGLYTVREGKIVEERFFY